MQIFLDISNWLHGKLLFPGIGLFLVLLLSLYWPGRKARIEQNAMIPLDEER
jgi:cbb3-type cytochrome oxidase subunit 3